MNKYVTIYEEYKHKFFQLPKVFFTNNRYLKMSNNAKVAWSILRDRSSLSRKNNWFDKDTGKIYFIYKNKELMDILNIKSETTLSKIKKELEDVELIEQQKIGFNRPNKIYLLYPVIEEADIYEMDKMENYQEEAKENEKEPKNHARQGTPKNGAPKNGAPYPQKVESSNTDLSDTDFKELDTKDTQDTEASSFKIIGNNSFREKQKKEYIQNAFYNNTEVINKEIATMLNAFSRNTDEAEKYYKIILTAKKKVEEEQIEFIWFDEDPELVSKVINTFSRAVHNVEKRGNYTNPKGYIYNSIYNMIGQTISERNRQKKANGD